MPTVIGGDLGDTVTLDNQGVTWEIRYWWRQDGGPRTEAIVNLPSALDDIPLPFGEQVLLELARIINVNRGVHD